MKIWQLLTSGLKKYENLACEVLEGSTRFSYFICHVCIRVFHISQIFVLFLSQKLRASLSLTLQL